MKLVSGDGKKFEVRNVSAPLLRLVARPGGPPVKYHRTAIVEDDEARRIARELVASRLYDREV